MGPTLQSKPAAKPAVKRRTRTKKEVKLPVLNIRSPFCAEVIRPNPQTEVASKSFSKCRPQPHVSLTTAQAASSHVSSSSGSKEPQTPTTTRKSFHNGVSMSTRSCIQGVIGPACVTTLQECLIITSLHHRTTKDMLEAKQLHGRHKAKIRRLQHEASSQGSEQPGFHSGDE
ncbi:uncharacterized protein LOC143414952 isoform X1 [Maylandia zebra]|uniref:uncharacterized protein LOC143414952 isoform X1 n=1 Tax=Maylandia zebra TaxID=106582 RepID=UPI00403D0046